MGPAAVIPSWFDLLVLLFLYLGITSGARRGMSVEIIGTAQWVAIVIAGGLFYHPLGMVIATGMKIDPSPAFVIAYVLAAGAVAGIVQWIRLCWGDQLMRKDRFGNLEYRLGMAAGAVRFGCILVALLALLHAKYIDTDNWWSLEFAPQESYTSGNLMIRLKREVFARSTSGRIVRRAFGGQLITPEPPMDHTPGDIQESLKNYERAVDRTIDQINTK